MTDKAADGAAVERAILTWTERAASDPTYWNKSSPVRFMRAEIDDLRAALKAQPAPTEAQGEDSARLDWIIKEAVQGATYHGITSANVIISEADWREFGLRAAIDKIRARASAETGGVKS